jgi:hypothetical protein
MKATLSKRWLALSMVTLLCCQFGCSKQEEPAPPSNSNYYSGPLATKPAGAKPGGAAQPGAPSAPGATGGK